MSFPGGVMNLVHKQKNYSTHIDSPELHVHCKLTQVQTPRGSSTVYVVIRQLPLLREEFQIPTVDGQKLVTKLQNMATC